MVKDATTRIRSENKKIFKVFINVIKKIISSISDGRFVSEVKVLAKTSV